MTIPDFPTIYRLNGINGNEGHLYVDLHRDGLSSLVAGGSFHFFTASTAPHQTRSGLETVNIFRPFYTTKGNGRVLGFHSPTISWKNIMAASM